MRGIYIHIAGACVVRCAPSMVSQCIAGNRPLIIADNINCKLLAASRLVGRSPSIGVQWTANQAYYTIISAVNAVYAIHYTGRQFF